MMKLDSFDENDSIALPFVTNDVGHVQEQKGTMMMWRSIGLSRFATLAVVTMTLATPQRASAYQIDCAILLCLAGGFPASAPCARAHAEMIRRITPWPIEPPLQLWRCPMGVGLAGPQMGEWRAVEATFRRQSQMTKAPGTEPSARVWKAFGETVTDYVMAIKVYDLTYRRHESSADDSCNIMGRFRIGSYGPEGEFTWRRADYSESPSWFLNTTEGSCSDVSFRAIGMEWMDYQGKKGVEVVPY